LTLPSLVEAARLDRGGALVAEAVPLSVDQNGAGGANERGPDPSACVPPAPQQPPEWKPQLMGVQQTCACFYEEEQFLSPRCRLMWRRQTAFERSVGTRRWLRDVDNFPHCAISVGPCHHHKSHLHIGQLLVTTKICKKL
jgi:hypothetical protein